jgi:serine/threonine-protein kinase
MIQRSSDGTEVVKIVDFGIAKLLPESGFTVERLTETGECFGTSAYMSPEQCMGRGLDTRSDIYSFGCVMYETLVGQPPFKGDNALDTIQKQIYMSAEPLSSVRSNLTFPLQIEQMVFKALEKDPACRYQSMHELREELEKLVDQMKDSGTEPQELPYL